MQAIYISSNQFKVSTDKTGEFLAGRRIRALCGSEYKYSTIYSSVYSSPYTTITIEENILTSNLTEVHYGIVNIGEQGSFPNHSHDGTEGTGGALSLLTLSDTPDIYEEGEYLRATNSGVEFAVPDDRYYTETELDNGQLDSRYYTKSEVDTISGSLQTNIDSHDHDDRYYTESEVDTISGTLQTSIDTKPDTEWFLTEGAPSDSIGKEDDISINQEVGTVYKKIPDYSNDSGIFYPAVDGDDGMFRTGVFFNTLNYITVDAQPYDMFIRFTNINIPAGAAITEAYVKFTAYEDRSSTVVRTNVHFNDVDDAVAPTDATEAVGLVLTGAITWDNLSAWVDGNQYDTPSLVSILQDIIDRAGWSSGQAVQVIVANDGSDQASLRSASAIDYSSGAEKAELHVEWHVTGGTFAWTEKLSPDFLKLSDTPSTYSGVSEKYLKSTTSGIEFVEDLYTKSEVDTISGSLQTSIDSMPSTLLELEDTPTTYSGVEGKYIKTTSSGIEFSQVTLLELSDTPTTYSGSVGNYLKTTSSGVIFSDIDSEYWESVDVFLDENYSNDKGLPTQVERGLFKGYSIPIWSTPSNQYEELVFRIRVPYRWDGTTNPTFMILVSISATEDVGDKFKFQMEWESKGVSNIIPDTTAETLTDEVVVTDGTAYYSYLASASLDATKLIYGENLQFRVRRIAATAPQVSNEIIIWHWDSRWKMNKLGTDTE